MEERKIDYSKKETAADTVVCHFAYVFDFYFNTGLNHIYQEQYLDKLYKRITFKDKKTSEKYKKVYETAKEYVKERIKDDKN